MNGTAAGGGGYAQGEEYDGVGAENQYNKLNMSSVPQLLPNRYKLDCWSVTLGVIVRWLIVNLWQRKKYQGL